MTGVHLQGRLPQDSSRPIALWLYALGALGLGLSALYGGGSLLLDPTGSTLQMPVELLSGTPFSDYLVPGAILFFVFGVGPFAVLFGLLQRSHWAWPAAVGLGVALVGWIAVQMLLLGTMQLLHLVYGGLGIVLVALAVTSSVRADLEG